MSRIPGLCWRCLTHRAIFPLGSTTTRNTSRLLELRRRYSTDSAADSLRISPVLLKRAQDVSKEHAEISERLANTFDGKLARRSAEISATATALQAWEKASKELRDLNSLLQDEDTDPELHALAVDEIEGTKQSLQSLSDALKQSLIPKHPFEQLPCLLEIRPGAGGDEAGIFANELMRMFTQFCARRGLRTKIIKHETDDSSGSDDRLAEGVIEVETRGSYGILRTEAGVHRVQRVPATETKGRTHTSAVSVMILPSFDNSSGPSDGDSTLNCDDPTSDYYVNPQDVHAEKMKAGGAGGQHVNKTESAIRLTYLPTGLVVSMQDSRSQHENRRKAWLLLRAKIADQRRQAREEELVKLRRGIMGGVSKMGRENKIRTYNFGQNRCTDHRSGLTLHNLDYILDGGPGLEKVMESVRGWLVDQDVDALVAEEEAKKTDGKNGTGR